MFWQAASFSRPSPIEQILEQENFSLEELLDEDDLIQETKSLNGRLVDFLKQPETVAKLVSLVVDPAPNGFAGAAEKAPDGPEARRLFKYPYVACEVFCCEVEPILGTLVGDAGLLGRLFAILEQPPPLDCVRAGYFSRVLHFLFARRWGEGGEAGVTNEVMDHLEANPQLLQGLVAHVRTTSVAEVLLRLLGADELEPSALAPQRFAWMTRTPVLERLLAQLAPESPLDAQQNAAHILSALARGLASPLAKQLGGPPLLSRLIERALAPDVSILALDICIALLEQRPPTAQGEEGAASGADSPLLSLADEAAARTRAAAVQEIGGRLGRLRQVLQTANPPDRQLPTPFGVLAPPLGTARLKAVELLAALVHTGEPAAETGLAEHGLLALCLALFTQFPFNNLLHHLVTGAVCFVLEHGSPALLAHLLEECRLVPWLVEAPEHVDPPGPAAAAGRRLRAGYLGHLTHIANRLADAATVRDAVAAALGATPAWGAWVEGTLRGRNETEDVLTWACGRPSRPAISTVASVDELDDDAAGLQEMEVLDSRGGAGGRYAGAAEEPQPAAEGSGGAGGGFFFASRNFPSHANDASAAFRLPGAGGAGFPGDDSSSSSSDDEEVQARPVGFGTPGTMQTAFRAASAFDSSSSSSSSDDEDRAGLPRVAAEGAVLGMPGPANVAAASGLDGSTLQQRALASGRQNSAGSGGSASSVDSERAAELASEGTADRARIYSDPTDLAWAAFPSAGETAAANQAAAASQAPDAGVGSWDPFGQANGQANGTH